MSTRPSAADVRKPPPGGSFASAVAPNEGWRLCAADARARVADGFWKNRPPAPAFYRQKSLARVVKVHLFDRSPSVAPRSKSILFATIKHGTGKPPKPCITHGCSPLAKLSAVGAVGAENVPLARHLSRPRLAPRPARARRRIVHDDHPVYLIVEYPSLSFILSMSPHVPQFDEVRRRVARPRRRPPRAPLARVAPPPRCTRSSVARSSLPLRRARVRPARASASSSPPPSRRSRARAPCDASSSSVALVRATTLCGRDARALAHTRAVARSLDRPPRGDALSRPSRRPSDAAGRATRRARDP